jgi:glycine/serine hydroxymethyltransferase
MGEREMDTVAELHRPRARLARRRGVLAMVKTEVESLCRSFPLYPERLASTPDA